MNIPLRKGFTVKSSDQEKISQIELLKSQKFISTFDRNSVICNRCSTLNLISSNNIEHYTTCKKCRKKISIHKINYDIQISSINYDKIIHYLNKSLQTIGMPYDFDKFRICWNIKVNSKTVPLLIPDISGTNSILTNSEEECTLYIMLDKEKTEPNINSINESQFVEFLEILLSPNLLKNKMKEVSEKFPQNSSIELESKFDTLLQKLDPYQFEDFCSVFLNSIKEKQSKLSSFYKYLSNKKSTMINSKIIPLGGSSNPDFYIIDLLDYLESAMTPGHFGEIKRYKKTTRFTFEDFSKGVMHGNNEPTLFLISTNNVQIEVWTKIIENHNNGKFLHVLLDKDIILLLIKCLELEHLLEFLP